MAQIIKHRRGSLESVASATKRAGELLVVTGSSGITATNGDSVLFLGVDGSTVTPANKILQGTSVPNLTGASYDTSIDGLPFYDTSAEKLYILNKAGNVEVKATANTGGTGIVSSSAQIDELGFLQVDGDSVVSGSSQITISSTTGYSTFSSSLASTDSALDGRITSLESFSSSLDGGFVTEGELAAATGALENADTAQQGRLSNIEGFTSSIDTTIKTKLDTDGVISGSSQVQIADVTGFSAHSSSVDSRLDTVEAAIGGGSNIDVRLSNLESTSASHDDRLDQLEVDSGSQAGRLDNLESFSSSIETAISVSGTDVTVNGNFTVSGTQTIVDSTTVQIGDNIIELNGSAASNGGLYVADATAPTTATGSLLWDTTNDQWVAGPKGSEVKVLLAEGDGVVSGSGQIDLAGVVGDTDDVTEGSTNLYYTDARVKTKLDAETVISGSSQVTIGDTTGYTEFSSSIATSISASVAGATWDNINGKPGGIVSGSSQVVDYLLNQTVNFGSGDISGSNLYLSGDANIDGNITLGGNITIGDASSDTISFGGEISSDIIPSADNTYDLGSATDKFAEIHGTNIYGTINGTVNATNGVISGSTQLDGTTLGSTSDIVASGSFSGSFVGDGSGLTGLATNLTISGSSGNDTVDLLNDDLTFAGGTGVTAAVTDNTVTYSVQDASTSQKGIASFGSTNFAVSSGNVTIKSGGVPATALNADVAGTGISLNGVDNSVEVDYGSTAGTAVEGNTSLTVQGTSNEIEVSGGSVTLGNGGTVTIGLPDSVTIATASIDNDLSVGGNVTVTGNLSVLGTTTTVDSTTVQIGDNILELNIGGAQSTAGLQVTDATAPNTVSGSLLWDGTNDYWKGGQLGSEKEFARLNTSPTSNTVLKADANGLLVDSLITDDGTNVTISGTAELRINAATANSFVYFDSNKSLEAVTPSNAGDVIQWNGSSFVASNELDGGTF